MIRQRIAEGRRLASTLRSVEIAGCLYDFAQFAISHAETWVVFLYVQRCELCSQIGFGEAKA
jgi:hypothetical protein